MNLRRQSPFAILMALSVCAVLAFAAHSKPRSIERLDAVFQTTTPGTIEASFNPPIQGVLRIVVHAQAQPDGATAAGPAQSAAQPFTFEVTQSSRPIPFRFAGDTGHHKPASARPSSLVADIDVNDLTPGMPVHIRVHSNLADPPGLDGHAYQVVY